MRNFEQGLVPPPSLPSDEQNLNPDIDEVKVDRKLQRGKMGLRNRRLAVALSLGMHAVGMDQAVNHGAVTKSAGEMVSKILKKAKMGNASGSEVGGKGGGNIGKEGIGGKLDKASFSEKKKWLANLGVFDPAYESQNSEYNLNKFLEQLKSDSLDINLGYINFPRLFLQKEVSMGHISAFEADKKETAFKKEAQRYFDLYNKFFQEEPEGAFLRVLHEIIQDEGDYDPDQPYFSEIVEGEGVKRGDCKARNKRLVALLVSLNRLGLSLHQDIKMQFNADPHIRLLIEIDDTWYVVERPTVHVIDESEVDGMAYQSPAAFAQRILGFKTNAAFMPSNLEPQAGYAAGKSDGFDLLPPGVRPTKRVFDPHEVGYVKEVKIPFHRSLTAQRKVSDPVPENDRPLEMRLVELVDEDLASSADKKQAPLPYRLSSSKILTSMLKGEFFVSDLAPNQPVDLKPLQNVVLKDISTDGGVVDMRELKDSSGLKSINFKGTRILGVDKFRFSTNLARVYLGSISFENDSERDVFFKVLSDKPLQIFDFENGLPFFKFPFTSNVAELGYLRLKNTGIINESVLIGAKNLNTIYLPQAQISRVKSLLQGRDIESVEDEEKRAARFPAFGGHL